MLKALFTIFIAIVALIIGITVAIGSKIYRIYASMKRSWSGDNKQQGYSTQGRANQQYKQANEETFTTTEKKVIGDNEGEYVEFEEIIEPDNEAKKG